MSVLGPPCVQPAAACDVTAGTVAFVPIQQVGVSFSPLRAGAMAPRADGGAELPLRVAPCSDAAATGTTLELVDGFKRLQRWREQGHTMVPVVIEAPARAAELKRLMLTVNAPACTTTPMDEARVVCSLIEHDGLKPAEVARLLGRKRTWVAVRQAIGTRLSPTAEEHVASGKVAATLAYALTSPGEDEQDAVLGSVDRHGLNARESSRLIDAYRAADPADRKQLLHAPIEHFRAEQAGRPTLSPTATGLDAELNRIQRTRRTQRRRWSHPAGGGDARGFRSHRRRSTRSCASTSSTAPARSPRVWN